MDDREARRRFLFLDIYKTHKNTYGTARHYTQLSDYFICVCRTSLQFIASELLRKNRLSSVSLAADAAKLLRDI